MNILVFGQEGHVSLQKNKRVGIEAPITLLLSKFGIVFASKIIYTNHLKIQNYETAKRQYDL